MRSPCNCGLGRFAELIEHPGLPQEIERYRNEFTKQGSMWSLKNWTSMFNDDFGNSIYRSSIESICFHLMEEAGEVAKANRPLTELASIPEVSEKGEKILERRIKRKKNLVEEIADTFSFLVAITTKLAFIESSITDAQYNAQDILEAADSYFVRSIVEEYADPNNPGEIICPACKKNPCKCEFYFD